MTTHLKARAAQAGVLLALTVGGVAVAPMAALAAGAQPGLSVTGVNPDNVLSGGKVTLQYRVTNNNGGLGGGNDQDDTAKVEFGLPSGTQCGDCGQQSEVQPGSLQNFTAHLTMPQVQPGQTQRLTVNITVTIDGASNRAQAQITVQGADKPQSVTAITGKVKDTNGKGVAGAVVGAQDSTGATFQSSTNSAGSFSILATDSKPIAPGTIQVGAGKDGFEDGAHVQVQGSAGKTVTVSLTLKALQASASASPSASASASAAASLDPGSVLSTDEAAGPQVNLPSDAAKNASQDSGSGSMLFVVLGALLVAAGIGAIVLVLMRRKNADKANGGGGDDPTAMGGGPGIVPPSQGRFNDATRVGSPMGAGPAAATMVAPRSGAPSMSDAPTMLHRPVPPVEDEFPDPYGAPLPQQGGYAGAAAGGWDNQAGGEQYGAPNQYAQPEDDYAGAGQYGAAAGAGQYAAAAPERFDEHTSLYRPESEQDGYGDYDQGGYAGAAGGGQYGAGAYGGGAAGGEYGAAAGGQYGGGAYGAGAGQPDDDYRAGGGGYQSGGGYGQEPADQGGYGSWGAPADGIDSGNGYGQYGGGTYGGAGAAAGGGAAGGGAAGGGAAYGGGQYGAGAGGGYDDRGGYDQGYDQPGGAGYGAGNEYGRGNARPPQQGGARPPQQGGYGYDQYEEQDSGAHGAGGGRRAYDDQQPSRRGGGRRPSDY